MGVGLSRLTGGWRLSHKHVDDGRSRPLPHVSKHGLMDSSKESCFGVGMTIGKCS